MAALMVHRAGPAVTVQDFGRTGHLSRGLSSGGAADLLALHEGAALLGQAADKAVLEMAGMGGVFEAEQDMRIALTGAPMQASIDGAPVLWNASHVLSKGQRLEIGGARTGVYGYLHVGGGFATPEILGARATHLVARLGRPVQAGERLPIGPDGGDVADLSLDVPDRFSGGALRLLPGMQTALFASEVLDRFTATEFHRGPRANRMGVELLSGGEGFTARGQLDIVSEVVVPGDIQMTGDGQPFVLMPECQTTGGYPRIGTVLPCDLPRVAQAPQGAALRVQFVTLDEAVAAEAAHRAHLKRLPQLPEPMVRDPAEMPDLLSYQLISGMVNARDPGGDT